MVILGQEVKDRVTGYKGIAVAITECLNGCNRVGVAAKVNKDNTIPDIETFDEPDLDVIGDGVVKPKPEPRKTGGPHRGDRNMLR